MNEAILPITASSVTAAHAWIEPQSWAKQVDLVDPQAVDHRADIGHQLAEKVSRPAGRAR